MNLYSIGLKSRLSLQMSRLPNVVFVLGGPGAGKGTQCSKIVESFGYVHLSAGDLLREERAKEGSQYGSLIEGHIKQGSIVPVEITCSLLERAMNLTTERDKEKINFLIDGFPRNKDNLDGWYKQMNSKANVKFVLFFNCDDQVCIDRCLKRGKLGSGRTDDNPESLKRRIETFNQSTKPIIEHYAKQNLVKNIDADRTPEEVFGDVKKIFSNNTIS